MPDTREAAQDAKGRKGGSSRVFASCAACAAENMTPEEFAAQTKAAAQHIGHLTDEGIERAKAILRETQAELALRLNDAPTEYSEWYYTQLSDSLDRTAQSLATRYRKALDADLDRVADHVREGVDRPLERAGINISLPQISRQSVELLSGYSPGELIGGLTTDLKTNIQSQLQQAILGTMTHRDLVRSLAKSLDDPGLFGSIQRRAEAIWRTESGRVYNLLAQERYRRIELMQPGRMKKQWSHSGNMQHPRSSHVSLGSQPPIPISEDFDVNGHPADGPHDPRLPASEVIRCGCSSYLVLADNPPTPSVVVPGMSEPTMIQLEQEVKNAGIAAYFPDLDPKAIRPTVRELTRLTQAYPNVARHLKYIEGDATRNWGPNTPAHYENQRILLNPALYGSAQRLQSRLADMGMTFEDVLAHEFGHAVHDTLLHGSSDAANWLTATWHTQVDAAYRTNPLADDWRLSRRAAEGGDIEAFAEAFRAAQCGDLSSRYAKELKDVLDIVTDSGHALHSLQSDQEAQHFFEMLFPHYQK